MFYDNLKRICDERGVRITPLVIGCGGTKGVIGGWKKGAMPNSEIVAKLSERLNVTTDLLIFGINKELPTELTIEEQRIIDSYRQLGENKRNFIKGELHTLVTFNEQEDYSKNEKI